jgi:hypothetical protein
VSGARRIVAGELYLSLTTVAEIWCVEPGWLAEVHGLGLLRRSLALEAEVFVAAAEMDRLASIVRLARILGGDLAALELELEALQPALE